MVLKNLFAGQQWRNRHRDQTYGHGVRGGEGEMCGKSNMETYITTCKIDSQWEFALWLWKPKQGLCINLEGLDGEGDGREVRKGGDICIKPSEVVQSCLTLCDPVDCSPPGSSIHRIFQARILEQVAISFSRNLPDPGIEPVSPAFQADALLSEPPEP